MKDEKEPKEEVQAEASPKGKDAMLAIMVAKNPEYKPENDDQLYDDFHNHHMEQMGELDKHRESNGKLAELVGKDPRFGATLGMAMEGKSFPYAAAKMYGKEPFQLEGDDLEEFEKGQQEHIQELANSKAAQEEARKNIENYFAALDKYCTDNGKSEEEKSALNDKIYTMADNFLNGNISPEVIELVDKGTNYDKDVQEAADAGLVEGKNQKIDATLKKIPTEVTDMGSNSASTTKKMNPQGGSFYTKLKA